VAEIEAAGGTAVGSYESVASPEAGQAIVGTAMAAFGRLDALVNNAGVLRNSFGEMTVAEQSGVLETHVLGVER
jgi:NAD(P)-dependent dehydrogenase (short-subunit alcohol dehydrogenase family)